MIARMKRVTVIVPEASVEASLEQLRDTGLVHVEGSHASSDSTAVLQARREAIRRELRRMEELAGSEGGSRGAFGSGPDASRASQAGTVDEALRVVSSFRRLEEAEHALRV